MLPKTVGSSTESNEQNTWLVLGISAARGFFFGALAYPMWTDNVERARWRAIRREFQVSDVLARTELPLQLPKVFEGETLTLYTIP